MERLPQSRVISLVPLETCCMLILPMLLDRRQRLPITVLFRDRSPSSRFSCAFPVISESVRESSPALQSALQLAVLSLVIVLEPQSTFRENVLAVRSETLHSPKLEEMATARYSASGRVRVMVGVGALHGPM